MKELKQIISSYEEAVANGKRTALATVVHVEGSAYRRPGARMLVTDDGEITGAISGGCLEGDALRKAQLVIAQQKPKLITYDTRDEEDAFIGRQLGCAGVISVLFEPIDPADPFNAIACLKQINNDRKDQLLITIFSLQTQQIGTCFWKQDQKQWGSLPDEFTNIELDIDDCFQKRSSQFIQYKNGFTVFFEFIPPVISLVLVGAGNDVLSMTTMADILGWELHVLDGRSTHARKERFPTACQVLVGKPEQLIEKIKMDHRTAFVLITHNYQYDLAMLKLLITKDVPYIGVLGPAKKRDRLLDELGIVVTVDLRKRIFGPAGLNIGAESPEEIALSIIAEIQAVMAGKIPSSLRDHSAEIHDRSQTLIQHK